MEERTTLRPDGVAVVELVGKLNMVSAGMVRQMVASLAKEGHPRVVIELSGVDFIDSSGLGALISGLKSTRQAGGDLRIAAPTPQAQLVLSLTGMERVLPPYPDADSAFS